MEHAVIIHITLSDRRFGTKGDHEAISLLENKIFSALEESNLGELDGEEFGEGECVIYTYGADADMLWSIIQPLLVAGPEIYRGYAIKRYGEPDDPKAREERVVW